MAEQNFNQELHDSHAGTGGGNPSPFSDDGASSHKYALTFGEHAKLGPGQWVHTKNMTWSEIVVMFSDHREGPKDGPCFLACSLAGTTRGNEHACEIGLAVFDSDSGDSLEAIKAVLGRVGCGGIIYSTHSHLTTTTRVSTDAFRKSCSTPEDFLMKEKHYPSEIAKGAKNIGEEGKQTILEHAPLPKYRIVIPLKRPWKASDYQNQAQAVTAWKAAYKAFMKASGLTLDSSCSDPSRLFFLPRHDPGRVFETEVIDGPPLDIWSIPTDPKKEEPEPKAEEAAHERDAEDESVIERFNRECSIEQALKWCGYTKVGTKWLSPHSTTGEPGISIKDGRAFCHHSSDPLFTGDEKYAHDAFSVFCVVMHDGDMGAAVSAASAKLGMKSFLNVSPGIEEQEKKAWPVLEPAAFYGFAGRFVKLATLDSEADPAAVLSTFLGRAGIEFGTSAYLQVGDSKHYPRINAVIVGQSAKARKGTSAAPVTRLFKLNEVGNIYSPAVTNGGPLSSGEGLVFAVRDEVKTWQVGKGSEVGKLVVSDPGIEDKRLFVKEEEFGAALKAAQRQGNTLSAIIRHAFDSGNISPMTKSNLIKTTGAHIGLLCHITIAELNHLLEECDVLNGFSNRFLWICARRSKLVSLPAPMPGEELRELQLELMDAVCGAASCGQVGLTPEAVEWWDKNYPSITKDVPGRLGAVTSRGEVMILRLALIYALLDQAKAVNVAHLDAAHAVWRYSFASARYIFGDSSENPLTNKLLDAIKKAGNAGLSKTELHAATGNNAKKGQIDKAVKELLVSGVVKIKKTQDEGRQKETFVYEKDEFN